MLLNEYQVKAMSFRLPSANDIYVITNLVSEVGELFGHLAKSIRDGAPAEFETLMKKELGDIMWSVAGIASDMGWTLDDVAQTNIDKLSNRAANGTIQGSGDNR